MTSNDFITRVLSAPVRRLLIALVAVPAILIGLLAMHVLMTTDGGHFDTLPAASMHHETGPVSTLGMTEAVGVATTPPSQECGGMCGPDHDMLGMICLLALLVTSVLLTLRLVYVRWADLRRAIIAFSVPGPALAPPRAPSLHVLSISRT
jgi:hypothetical protein